jgi:hypothetical protein
MTSWLRFGITVRLAVFAFVVVKSGFLVIGAPQCLRCMLSRRSGLCARMPLKNLKLQIKMYLLIKLPQSRRSCYYQLLLYQDPVTLTLFNSEDSFGDRIF